MYFPTAIELRYKALLNNIKNAVTMNSYTGFIDVNTFGIEISMYLRDKGYKVIEIRYEYNDENVYGFWGRTSGNGICVYRIIWDDSEYAMNRHGNFYR